jgi:hypothetical protein
MRISTKCLVSIIKEAVSSELDIKSIFDADIMLHRAGPRGRLFETPIASGRRV